MPVVTSPVFRLPKGSRLKLRDQICELISGAIARGALPPDMALPSCRELADQLDVSRNTVFSAYAQLVDLGLLEAKDRSGYYAKTGPAINGSERAKGTPVETGGKVLSFGRFAPSRLARVRHPADWSKYPFPFIYNQTDPKLFPIGAWRECSRQALNMATLTEWTGDYVEGDSPYLLQQLRQRLLIYRGIIAADEEVMITLGAQNALSIIGLLMSRQPGAIAVEDPGYPDARNAFLITGNQVQGVAVDEEGLRVADIPAHSKLVYTTPSHQFPTSVTMSIERRTELLQAAHRHGFLVLEDDYEAEMNSAGVTKPALRSLDREDRVIYVGSLSKTLSPGLRIGFIVANRDIIREARAIRTALLRHPPTVIQETTALFIGLGYYDRHLRNFVRRHDERWRKMKAAIEANLSAFGIRHSAGGTSFWLTGPPDFDASRFSESLMSKGVIIDKGETFFLAGDAKNSFRLGFAYVDDAQIEKGLKLIGREARAWL